MYLRLPTHAGVGAVHGHGVGVHEVGVSRAAGRVQAFCGFEVRPSRGVPK